MSDFKIHDAASAPEAAQPLLKNSLNAFGMIPNLHGVMAESPVLLEGYQILHGLAQKTSFDKDELTVVWQSINVEHACHYCVPAHSGIAKSMGVTEGVNKALRNETALPSEKLNILRTATLEILRSRGHLTVKTKQAFFNAGYSNQQILDIVLVLSQKVMSNYVNHLAETPVDDAFKAFAWEPKD